VASKRPQVRPLEALPLVALVMSAAFSPAAHAAGTPPSVVTIRATGNVQMAITLRTKLTIFNDDPDPGDSTPTVSIVGGGETTGFALVPADPNIETPARLTMPRPDGGSESLRNGEPTPSLPAGRYTLRVVATGAVTIRLPVRGLTSRTWRPATALTVRTPRVAYSGDIGQKLVGRAALHIGSGSLVFALTSARATGVRRQLDVCLTAGADCRTAAWTRRSFTEFSEPLVEDAAVFLTTVDRRVVPPGAYTGIWTVSADLALRSVRTVVVVVG
jgi:hypothetical protein